MLDAARALGAVAAALDPAALDPEVLVLRLRDALGETTASMRARHTNME